MAVYTHVDEDALAGFMAHYDLGPVIALKGIAEGVENSNYLLQTAEGNFILTLYEKRVDENDLPFFLDLMHHLADKGIPCPLPVDGKDGESLRELCGRPAALISFLRGLSLDRPTPAQCDALGEGLARMHLAVTDFDGSRDNALGLDGWRDLAGTCAKKGDSVEPGLTALIGRELEHLAKAWPADLPTGVIHADLFPDNVFFIGEELTGFIDFYFACTDAFAYDLAICLNAWCFEPDGSFNATKARRMTSAYTRVRPLSEAEVNALPTLARGAALRFLLTRLYDWINQVDGALVRPKDPREYAKKLRFHQRVKGPGEYGLT